jgi:hypothetical protein
VILDLVSIVAIILGPSLGVCLAYYLTNRSEKRGIKVKTFCALLAYRKIRTHQNCVEALNIIEVIFSEDKNVLNSYKNYMDVINKRPQQDQTSTNKWLEELDDLYAKLLHSISNALGFVMSEIDLMRGGYSPQKWGDDEFSAYMLRKYLIELFEDKKVLPVHVVQSRSTNNKTTEENF